MARLAIMKGRIGLLGIAVALLAGVPPGSASSDGKRGCTSINLGGPKVFSKENMRCKTAKHYARRVYRTNGEWEPRNFDCSSGSNFDEGGSCTHDSKPKYFFWHVAD